jgi:serpin B
MWRKVPARLAGLALVLSLGAAAAPPNTPPLLRAGDARLSPVPGAPVPRVVQAVTDLGYRMGSITPAGNWVASPLSVAYAYGMVRAGAGGSAAAALDRLFGVPGEDLHPALNAITTAVGDAEVSITNGIFVHQGFPVGSPFLHTLATQYGTGVHPVDFTAPGTAEKINNWISEQTHGRIPSIYREDRNVRLVLANTIYLDAKWVLPFGGATATVPMPFRTATGPVTVPMMHQAAEIPYAEGDGWQAAELAYRDSDLVMRILLPAPGVEPVELLRNPEIGAALKPARIDLRLPKWEFQRTVELGEVGPPELFDNADFSAIGPGLQIGQATHQAWIKVDEEGTEAAAATVVGFRVSATVPPEIQLHADRPFAFVLLHKPTGVPLFVGRVADPS